MAEFATGGEADTAPTMKLRDQQRLFTRQRLITAAMEVFYRDGYSSARIEDVAAAAGARRATFYLHFKSKLDVIRAILAGLRSEFDDLYEELGTLTDPSREDLHGWITHLVGYWDRNRPALQVVNQAAAVESELAHDVVARINVTAAAMTQHFHHLSTANGETARLRASMFIMQLERFCYFWKVCGEPFDEAAALDALTDSAWFALQSLGSREGQSGEDAQRQ